MPDIARDPSFLKRRRLRRIGYGIAAVLVLIAVSIVLARMEPAPPGVDADALLQLQSAQAQLENLRVQYENEILTQESQAAALAAEFQQAKMDAEANEALAKEKLVSELLR